MNDQHQLIADFKALHNKADLSAYCERNQLGLPVFGEAGTEISHGKVGNLEVRIELTTHDRGGAAPELPDMAALMLNGQTAAQVMFSPPGWQEA